MDDTWMLLCAAATLLLRFGLALYLGGAVGDSADRGGVCAGGGRFRGAANWEIQPRRVGRRPSRAQRAAGLRGGDGDGGGMAAVRLLVRRGCDRWGTRADRDERARRRG